MAKVKVRRAHREELPGIAILRDAVERGAGALPGRRGVLDLDMEVDPDLDHLQTHDRDGFFTAVDGGETLGFASAHVRSRQCVLSGLWVLPQHQGRGAGEALLEKVLAYAESSGAREYLALVPVANAVQSLLLRYEMAPITPVYTFHLDADTTDRVARSLMRLFPGQRATTELLARRGQADVDRVDRVTRNVTREVDHEYWLKKRGLDVALVRQGARIAAYAYGGADRVGPAVGTTREAALAAIGWALQLTAAAGAAAPHSLRVPARFTVAVENLLEGGARIADTELLYGRGVSAAFDRLTLGPPTLP